MRYTILCIFFLLSYSVKAQNNFSELKTSIFSGNVQNIIDFVNSTNQDNTCNQMGMGSYVGKRREIIPGYFHIEMDINFCKYLGDARYSTSMNKLNLLLKDSTVFYSTLNYNSKFNDSWVIKNETLVKEFNNAYYDFYGLSLSMDTLFDRVVFGYDCGEDGGPTWYSMKIEPSIHSKNVRELQNLLRSSNVGWQLFAIYGFKKLRESGYKLDTKTLKLIQYILNKEGTIDICMGCVGDEVQIQDVKQIFKLTF